jgi:hypothetical protein
MSLPFDTTDVIVTMLVRAAVAVTILRAGGLFWLSQLRFASKLVRVTVTRSFGVSALATIEYCLGKSFESQRLEQLPFRLQVFLYRFESVFNSRESIKYLLEYS